MTTYDYVIIGAGSAGCVLAARLSEDPDTRVLVLEAGPPDDAAELAVPGAVFQHFKGPYDWDYTTTPQRHAGARRLYVPRGRALGGSSTTNGLAWIRGVDGLRVVDASVLPKVTRGNTQAPVIAVAERAADLIRGRRPLPPAQPAGSPAGPAHPRPSTSRR